MARALLTFWMRPAEATEALAGKPGALLAPLAPAGLIFCHLWIRGCAPADAAVTGAALFLIVTGLGLGGALACYPASFVTQAEYRIRDRLGPCQVFAAWTAILFAAVLLFCRAIGIEAEAALAAALVIVVWGGAAGTSLVIGDEPVEGGRMLVGSCMGLAGALGGLLAGLFIVSAKLVLLAPAPADVGGMQAGDMMLVRRTEALQPKSMVLLQHARESVLARVGPQATLVPLGNIDKRAWTSTQWSTGGRVFFRFGGNWGGSVVSNQHFRQ